MVKPLYIMYVNFVKLQDDQEWEFPRDKLELGCILGEGSFGKVVKAVNLLSTPNEDFHL